MASAGQVLARGWRRPLDVPFSALIPRHRIAKPGQRNGEEDCADGGHRSKVARRCRGRRHGKGRPRRDGGNRKSEPGPFFPLPPFPAGLDAQCDALWVFGLDE